MLGNFLFLLFLIMLGIVCALGWKWSAQIAGLAERKGLPALVWRLVFLACSFFGAILALIIGVAIVGGSPLGFVCGGGMSFLVGGLVAGGAVMLAVTLWPEPPRTRTYMDDYDEYQRTGRVHDYRRDYDDFADDRPRRRDRDRDEDRRRRRREEDY